MSLHAQCTVTGQAVTITSVTLLLPGASVDRGKYTADNGCLQIWSNAGVADRHPTLKPSPSEGQSVPVEAGTAIVMGDRLMHSSLPNSSNYTRRAWMPQFSQQPILMLETDCPVAFAVPLF